MAEESFDNGDCYDLSSLLATEERDFLIRNNGDQVKIKDLIGKTVGLYFSASWCPPCRGFTPSLIEVYKELSSKGDFEIVFVSSDRDEESFQEYFSKMPWLAIPISDEDANENLSGKFNVMGIPHFVILGKDGEVLSNEGVQLVMEYEAQAYPFTPERINQLKEEEEEAKRNQNLQTLLVSGSRDYVITNDEKKVPVTELEGKMVGLYFCVGSYGPCIAFTKKLIELYKELKKKGENFELVLIYLDDDYEDGFKEVLAQISCVALPHKDKKIEKLARYFELSSIPMLVIIGPDGKTLNPDVVELIDEHGAAAYPFTPEKLAELAEIEKAKLESQTLESILVSGEKDYVPVSQLVGKHVLIYFSAHWCPPCRAFTPKLIEAYHEIKAKESEFEIIFASSDRDQSSFDEYYSDMPWLALPFGDERKTELSRKFKVRGIPSLVAIGPEGKTVTTEARHLIGSYGADAFPFTEDHIKKLKEKIEEMAKGWPEKIKHELHEHELVKTRRDNYYCDGCDSPGNSWSFLCKDCDFDLDPKCALKNVEKPKKDENMAETKDGYICEGDVCRKI
ncbi:putative nucleoredoxin 1-2 [Bienertia sinuspersici]